MRYVLRRLGFYLVAAWASITLNFFLPRMMPGDPATAIFARFQGQLDPGAIDSMREAYGLAEGSLISQYWDYLSALFRGEFGMSVSYFPSPVIDVISTGLSWTLLLGTVALLISCGIGILLGIVSAWYRGRSFDTVLPPLTILIGSFPYFWIATLALFFLSFRAGVFPLKHAHADNVAPSFTWAFISSVAEHLALPALTIIVVSVGGWLLNMRNTMIGVLSEDYVTFAEAKGLSSKRVMFRYAARNALLPNVTTFGMSLGFILSGSLLTEVVFSYPGMGNLFLTAVQSSDYALIQGLFLITTLSVLTANLIVDLLYVRLDPRVRSS